LKVYFNLRELKGRYRNIIGGLEIFAVMNHYALLIWLASEVKLPNCKGWRDENIHQTKIDI